ADAGKGHERQIGTVAGSHDLPIIVVERYARFDVIGRESDATVAVACIDRDSAGRGKHARDAVLADAIGAGATDRMGDLSHHRLDDEFLAVIGQWRLNAGSVGLFHCALAPSQDQREYQSPWASSQGLPSRRRSSL